MGDRSVQRSRRFLAAVLTAAVLLGLAAAAPHIRPSTPAPPENDAPAAVDYYETLPAVQYGGVRERSDGGEVRVALSPDGLVLAEAPSPAGRAAWYPVLASAVSLHSALEDRRAELVPLVRVFVRGGDLAVHLRAEREPPHWDGLLESVRQTLHRRQLQLGEPLDSVLLPTRPLPAPRDADPPFAEVAADDLVPDDDPGERDFIFLVRRTSGGGRIVLERVAVPRADGGADPAQLVDELFRRRYVPDRGARGWPVADDVAPGEVELCPEAGEVTMEFAAPWWENDCAWSRAALDCLRATVGGGDDPPALRLRAPGAESLRVGSFRQPVNDLPPELTDPGEAPDVVLHAVGDVMLDRGVRTVIEQRGADYPFAHATPVFRAGDLTFINLESPLAETGEPLPGKGIWFRGDPEYAAALHRAGVDVVNFANNHSLDYGRPAFLETFTHLRRWGILAFGGGRDIDDAHRPLFWEGRGVRMAFLGYTDFADIFWDWHHRETFAAGEDLPGVAPLDASRMLDDVRAHREEADALIVSVHWGDEYVPHPPQRYSDLAAELVREGADAILGHHPHVLQCVNVVDDRPILHSLGNFIFDQTALRRTESVIARLQWRGETGDGRLRPTRLDLLPMRIREGQPAPAEDDEVESILDYLWEISRRWEIELRREGDMLQVRLAD